MSYLSALEEKRKVYILMIDPTGNMRSSEEPYKAFSTRAAAEAYLKENTKEHWNTYSMYKTYCGGYHASILEMELL